MKETVGDLFKIEAQAICIPTNGATDKTGNCVMGTGLAREVANRWPVFPKKLGNALLREGNVVHILTCKENSIFHGAMGYGGWLGFSSVQSKSAPWVNFGKIPEYHILSFPTRPAKIYPDTDGWGIVLPAYRGQQITWNKKKQKHLPGWMGYPNLNIIKHSAEELVEITNEWGWQNVALPTVGCSREAHKGLDWLEVKKILEDILDDRFTIVHYKSEPTLADRIRSLVNSPSRSDVSRGEGS